MDSEKESNPTKQIDLLKWLPLMGNSQNDSKYKKRKNLINKNPIIKPKLAFGFGFDPMTLKNGIIKYSFSHNLEGRLKLYEFEPRLSYRIFNVLAKILRYKCEESEIRHENTIIKNKYFITDQKPDVIISKLNKAISKIFDDFEPVK
ncbi:hypothetical protein LCGC14_0874300 [marine sediment metagenome]|uniref:Uncharacterized protein n=1 Tax=marine sediment metagenome TaxID=412755 RepID=A0A0F9P8R3_9ZZZZ|nr:hypothetical protein [bacterium]